MDDEIDPYERQLLAVFKSCDNYGNGVLDKNGFTKLCDTLQLEELHRNQMTTRLCNNGKCKVVFPEFRDALLAVLASYKLTPDDDNQNEDTFNTLEQEISPKFVFGGKKYGRRSRPASTDQEEEKTEKCITNINGNTFTSDAAYSKELFMETDCKLNEQDDMSDTIVNKENDFEIETLCKHLGVSPNKKIRNQELISICSSLGIPNSVYELMEENIAKLNSISNGIDNKREFTYKELFQLIKNLGCLNTKSTSIGIANIGMSASTPFNEDGISVVDINASGCISYDTLVYLFENAGINDAGVFLNDLGISPQFDVNLSELAIQLQEELLNVQRCMDDSSNHMCTLLNPHLLLLQASVVVSQAQITWYKSCMEQMQCERDKLRSDLLVANERASLLAQEVDDNHARMESSVQLKLRSLEQKHCEQVKKLTYQWSTEREQLANQNLKIEKQLEQLLHDETKLRSEVASLKQDYENLEKENRNLLDQLVNAETARGELEREIQRLSLLKKKVLELESSNEQAISFLEKMNQLQEENIMLRDKNDELVVELENVTFRQMQNRNGGSKRRGNSPIEGEESSDTDVATTATHRMFPKVRKYSTEKDLSMGIDGPHSETLNSGFMYCESGVEADISTSSSSLDRIGEVMYEANDKTIVEFRSRVAFLENFIKKYQLKIPFEKDDVVTDIFIKPFDSSCEKSADDLEKQCETLQLRLDQVQKEILKILTEKRACTEENCALKIKISELVKHLPCSDVADNVRRSSLDVSVNSSLETVKVESWSRLSSFEEERQDAGAGVVNLLNHPKSSSTADNADENELVTSSDNVDVSESSSTRTLTVDTSCSSMFATVSEEESEMEWKTIGDERKTTNEATDDQQNYNNLVENYKSLKKENKSLLNKCEELGNCLEMLRNEYDQCEEYWASKLDEERKIFEEEQKINDEKFAELQAKIEEYSVMFDCETMSSQMISKLPTIVENDKLENEVTELQDEFKAYREIMEVENLEKQREIERLMQIISLYENAGTVKNLEYGMEQSLESVKSDKTYVLDNLSSDLLKIPTVDENVNNAAHKDAKISELKLRKKQLRKECEKLIREKESLMDQMIKMNSEPRTAYRYIRCNHAAQQYDAELSKNGILLRLRHQEMKNRNLRNTLLQQQKKLNKTMRDTLEQHEKELAKYRTALDSSQEMWQSLQDTTKKQAEQIALSDILVKELYCENSQLMATIHQLEQQHLDCPSPVLL